MRRIGLLGGTFDPVHEGHLAIAGLAQQELALEEVIFIPAPDPPHKVRPGASFQHRVAMLELALEDNSERPFSVSLLEAEREQPSYTVDTLVELKKRLGEQQFFFIMGADSLLELHLWYRYPYLLELTNLVVAARPGITFQEIQQAVTRLPGPFTLDPSLREWRRPDGREVHYLAGVADAVSSSVVRSSIARGRMPENLAPSVRAYIEEFHLYRMEN